RDLRRAHRPRRRRLLLKGQLTSERTLVYLVRLQTHQVHGSPGRPGAADGLAQLGHLRFLCAIARASNRRFESHKFRSARLIVRECERGGFVVGETTARFPLTVETVAKLLAGAGEALVPHTLVVRRNLLLIELLAYRGGCSEQAHCPCRLAVLDCNRREAF